jgi:hypothetical protein
MEQTWIKFGHRRIAAIEDGDAVRDNTVGRAGRTPEVATQTVGRSERERLAREG